MLSVERVEVVRGGGSTAWGNSALGGVVNILTRPVEAGWTVEGLAGNRDTYRLGVRGGAEAGPVTLGLDGQYFETGGYHTVHPDQRGPVDIPADSRNRSAALTGSYRVGPEATLTIRGGGFAEDRGNGTSYTGNETRSGRYSARLDFVDHGDTQWEWTFYGEHSTFASTFSSVNQDRSAETPALDQFDVPSRVLGTAVQFWRETDESNTWTGALDLRQVSGETNEDFRFDDGRFLNRRRTGGSQGLGGIFLENAYEPDDRWRLSVGGRFDYWRQYDGELRQTDLETGETTLSENFADRDGAVFSPRAGVVHRVSEAVGLRGSVYRGFRVPTINELYRPFRVGADETRANPALEPERLTGAEIGADLSFSEVWSGQVAGFWNNLRDPITNVTIGDTPAGGTLRQRQNLGRASIFGVEVETGVRVHETWRLSAGLVLNRSIVRRASRQPALEGRRLAQAPGRQATLRSRWNWGERYLAEIQGRYIGPQFEDDLNTRRLPGYWVADLYAARQIGRDSAVFVGVENLFDRRYRVGETGDGLVTIGQPVMIHGGMRWRF